MIHVGPHKTGSTHVQGSLLALNGLIQNRTNYMQPFFDDSGFINLKMQSFFANELHNLKTTDFRYLNQLKTFLHIAHEQHHNVLISSEELSFIPLDGASYFSNMVHNFQAKVVITFRDSLSRALSNYRQLYPRFALSDEVPLPDFRAYVQRILESMRIYYSYILDMYAKEFGVESLVIIDYDGAIAAKKDLVQIILCEICKILCQDLSQGLGPLFEREHLTMIDDSNPAESHIPLPLAGVISEIRVSMQQKKCNIPVASQDKVIKFILLMIGKQTLPTMTKNLSTLFYNETLISDDIIRKKYKNQMLYNNRNASIEAVERQVVTELDFNRFRSDPYWQKWTRDVTSSLVTNSTIIAC